MKILFVCPQLPYPLDQGTRLRNFSLIRAAAAGGHVVHVLGLATPPVPRESLDALGAYCQRVETVPPPRRPLAARVADVPLSSLPDLALRLWTPAMLQALQRLHREERYDVVQLEGLEMAAYGAGVRGAFVLLDEHNVEHRLQERAFRTSMREPRLSSLVGGLYSLVQWRRLRSWEAQRCAEAHAVVAVSASDGETLCLLARRQVAVVPNSIDLAATPYVEPDDPCPTGVLFTGTMDFRPNHDAARWFADYVLPRLRQRHPELRFWVVGRNPHPDLVAYNQRPTGVVVTGGVETIEPYWARAGVYVLPMRYGGGVRFKALEALARGLPLVSTRQGVEGIDVEPGRHYLAAETSAEFAGAVERLLADGALRRTLARQGREAVARLDWPVVRDRLLALYERLEARRGTVVP
ncbi:MAG: glycosyltransferase [Chloroflexi bacterium]|nr:glycosyltransferase [Chloroflexota bacterium]